jgi:hypothetical protein
MLLTVARLFTWIAGGSAALLLVYFRFILPRLTESYKSRHALQLHQTKLLERFNKSVKELKDSQESQLDNLPRLPPFHEAETFTKCETVEAALAAAGDVNRVPDVTLLRCAIAAYLAEHKRGPTSEELFASLEAQAPSIVEDEKRRESLWKTLTSAPSFHSSSSDPSSQWSYTPPPPTAATPIVSSLSTLRTSLPEMPTTARHPHVLAALVDFTGYLTAQTYSFGAYGRQTYGGTDTKLSPAAEEARREIRALKGLVLNRRSFMAPATAVISS